MRTLNLWLVLGLVAACSPPPVEVSTEGTTTESSHSPTSTPNDTTAGTSSANTTMPSPTGGEEVCPPMPPDDGSYDACPGLCGGGGQCFSDHVDYGVCTRGCFMDCNCWVAPGDGEAPAICSNALLESTSVCVLDCSAGQSCPQGMFCVADLGICAFPYQGSETTSSTSTDGSSSGSSDSGTTGGSSGTTGGTTTGSSTSGSTGTGGSTGSSGGGTGSSGGTGSGGGTGSSGGT